MRRLAFIALLIALSGCTADELTQSVKGTLNNMCNAQHRCADSTAH
jgi:hypothetical protein